MLDAGLVLELNEHRMHRASKLLAPKCNKLNRFILVKKKQTDPNDDDYDPVVPYYYVPLIDDCASLYPEIKVFFSASFPRHISFSTIVTELDIAVVCCIQYNNIFTTI